MTHVRSRLCDRRCADRREPPSALFLVPKAASCEFWRRNPEDARPAWGRRVLGAAPKLDS